MKISRDSLIILFIYIFFIIAYIALWNFKSVFFTQISLVFQFLICLIFFLLITKIFLQKKILLLLIAFFGSILVSLFFHHAEGSALTYLIGLFLIFLFNNLVVKEKEMYQIHFFIAILLTMFIMSLTWIAPGFDALYDIRGDLINSNTVGIIIICTFFNWRCCLDMHKLYFKIIYLILIFLTFIGLQYTGCRSALLVFIFFLLLDLFKHSPFSNKMFRNITIIMLIISLIIPYIYVYVYNVYYNLDIAFFDKNLFTGRQFVWQGVINQIKEYPIFGCGNDFYLEMGFGRETSSPHNFLLGTWKIFGIIPVCIIIGCYVNFICPIKKYWSFDKISQFACISSILLFFTESIFTGAFLPILVLIFLLNKKVDISNESK